MKIQRITARMLSQRFGVSVRRRRQDQHVDVMIFVGSVESERHHDLVVRASADPVNIDREIVGPVGTEGAICFQFLFAHVESEGRP